MAILAEFKKIHGQQVKKKAALLAQRRKIDEALRHIDHALVHLEAAMQEQAPGATPGVLGVSEGAERIFEIHEGKPLSMRQLAQEMAELGVDSHSKRFGATVYATLRQSGRFVRRKDRLWQRTADAPPEEVEAWQKQQAKFLAKVKKNRGQGEPRKKVRSKK
jgi:hypothetical protein